MSRHPRKYIAEGFLEDSSRLLHDFVKQNSLEFGAFATVWNNHNFSLIFMGRKNQTESSEFVNETFRISMLYFMEPGFELHVGAVYMMYALFVTQNSDNHPPIKIRIERKGFEIIKSLRAKAIEMKIDTLHYVIDYLTKNAFLYVACQSLRGPLIAGVPSPYDVQLNERKEECLELYKQFSSINKLDELRDIHKRYSELKKKVEGYVNLTPPPNENIYEKALEKMKILGLNTPGAEPPDNIGDTRMKIKAEAFKKKPKKKRYTPVTETIVGPVRGVITKDGRVKKPGDPVKKVRVPKRPCKEDKRPGRPRQKPKAPSPPPEKNSSDEEIDITHLLTQQYALYTPQTFGRVRASKTKRDPYYQVSPKRQESDSESDIDMPN